jgi:cytochrome b561
MLWWRARFAARPQPRPRWRAEEFDSMYWIIALLALAQLGIGSSLGYFPQGSQGAEIAFMSHFTLGIGVVVLVIVIPIWRLVSRSGGHASIRPHWLQVSLRVSESLLFVLLLATALAGYLAWAFSSGSVPGWAGSLPPALEVGSQTGAMFARWHQVSAIAAAIPILGTLTLLAWAVVAGHGKPHHRRVLVPNAAPPASGQEPEESPDEDLLAKVRRFALRLKVFGAIAFWLQLCLGLIAVLLLVVTTSSSYYQDNVLSRLQGFSWADGTVWAYFSVGVLALTVVGFYACILLSRPLRRGELPGGGASSIKRLITTINFGSVLGLTLAIIGTAFSIALLISKTVSEPPGIAITDPQLIVRAVDVFVLLANFVVVVAHFAGILICLWVLHRLRPIDCRPSPTDA